MKNVDTTKIVYLDKWVNTGKKNSFTLTNTSIKAYNSDNTSMVVSNILRDKYRGVITSYMINATMTSRWYYKPKEVSYQLYNTVELWHMLLWLNNMTYISEFCQSTIKIFNPKYISLLTTIINRESETLQELADNPEQAIVEKTVVRREAY